MTTHRMKSVISAPIRSCRAGIALVCGPLLGYGWGTLVCSGFDVGRVVPVRIWSGFALLLLLLRVSFQSACFVHPFSISPPSLSPANQHDTVFESKTHLTLAIPRWIRPNSKYFADTTSLFTLGTLWGTKMKTFLGSWFPPS